MDSTTTFTTSAALRAPAATPSTSVLDRRAPGARTTAWYRKQVAVAEVSTMRSAKFLGNHIDGWPPGPRNGSSG